MAERDEFGAFLIGFIIGGLTGAAVSLLLAPQSGEETREYLRERAIELRDKAADTAQSTYAQVEGTAGQVRERAGEIASKARTTAEEQLHRGQVLLEEQRSKITDTVQSLRSKDQGPTEA
jgi:gas vesicle protein